MKQFAHILALGVVLGLVQFSHAQTKCAANGEYCLTHNDCCSRSCLSFSYKCVPVPPSAIVGTTRVPVTIDTSNRFGANGDGGASITQKSCAKNGEYCLTASDCCSRSCLSFSYKCVQNYPTVSQITDSGIPVQQPVPVNTIDTANRFGGNGGSSSSSQQCARNGQYCFHSGECCSRACYKSICSTQITLGVPESELTRPHVGNGPLVQVNSLDELINRFGGGSPSSSVDSTGSASQQKGRFFAQRIDDGTKQCHGIGETCSRQEDCCSNRCHSYRRKCVT